MIRVRSSTWALITLFSAIVLVFSLARVLAIIVFVSSLISIVLHPLVTKLSKKISRGYATLGVLLVFIALMVTMIGWIIANISPGFAKLVREIPNFLVQVRDLPNSLPIPTEAVGYVDSALRDAANIAVEIAKNSSEALLHVASGIVELIAIPVITFYFLKDGERVVNYFTQYLQKPEQLRIVQILGEIKTVLRKYVQGQCIVSSLSAATVCLYFSIVGLPYVLVFAAISAVAELAPVVGPTVAAVLASLLAYAYSPALAAKTLLFYIIMLKINHNLVYPTLIGKATKLHPVAIVAGVLFFGHIFGVIGMVLAVPVLAIAKIIFEHYAARKGEKTL